MYSPPVVVRSPAAGARRRARGFTLIEVLVTIGIIVLLVGMLFPVIGKVRRAAYNTDSLNFISVLQNSITRYHQDFNAYPGPFSNADVSYGTTAPFSPGANGQNNDPSVYSGTFVNGMTFTPSTSGVYAGATTDLYDPSGTWRVTMAENLVLGLLGGMEYFPGTSDAQVRLVYNPDGLATAKGPMRLARPRTIAHTRTPAYMEAKNLSWRKDAVSGLLTGKFKDDAGEAEDSIIPEFVDSFPSPMPILYLRARRGVTGVTPSAATPDNNPVITDGRGSSGPNYRVGAYDLSQVIPYTSTTIGEGRRVGQSEYKAGTGYTPAVGSAPAFGTAPHGLQSVVPGATLGATSDTYCYPYDAYAYFVDPAQPGNGTVTPAAARQKDGYILIGAGVDRVYGTSDDQVSFGEINP